MSFQTHYGTLGLAPNAPPEVIRAAHKALVLIHHPDKTIHRRPSERVSHAAVFKDVQEAYWVLTSPSLKAVYDAELVLDIADDASHHRTTTRTNEDTRTTPRRKGPLRLTTPEEKAAMVAKARQQIERLREQRTKRDVEKSELDVAGLKHMIQIWNTLAEENALDPPIKGHCVIRRHEYKLKLAERDRQHEEWLAKMATSKHVPSTPPLNTPNTPAPRRRRLTTGNPVKPVTTAPSSPRPQRVEQHNRAEVEQAARAAARTQQKAQREAARQAIQEEKSASVRAEKEKQQARMQKQARIEAGRIARARAKARSRPFDVDERFKSDSRSDATATPNEVVLAVVDPSASSINDAPQTVDPRVNKSCGKCGSEHATFSEWKKCNLQIRVEDKRGEGAFFQNM